MVRLTITPSIVEGLKKLRQNNTRDDCEPSTDIQPNAPDSEPSLLNPKVGKPITHGQIIHLWQQLRAAEEKDFSLETLLRGSQVYMPPPPPKPEPSEEYKALMARLRREEEERSYQRMVKQSHQHHQEPFSRMDAFARRFPHAGTPGLTTAQAYAEINRPTSKADEGDDDVTYAEVHRQLMLLLNFLVSIVGVAATIWVAARWWSTTSRLLITLAGAILVAVAEVVVYSGYMRKLGEAKQVQEKVKEEREVVQTWVVGPEGEKGGQNGEAEEAVLLEKKVTRKEEGFRRRFKSGIKDEPGE
ncbi:hypothetical protein SODALDRAFT_5245 [Sodiomyces alkalinus F11]|uniref:Endoplasmic reticulum-based factor for assembly of V-ATPase n=1 Tax=Sodiomyces alkalinus (strain CBS 110278 / VKM F-3762 / F11) TaxID=1314773 RepID=A0A3N2Q5G4_SODAK|nr:hypothetical protein SODALDRAFT_5245 [Sodiomyces alkalinus F11]ROT42014.1 hypothetical protein SODALDRAFT_5245 [Sodiomyces alkalinus F11]